MRKKSLAFLFSVFFIFFFAANFKQNSFDKGNDRTLPLRRQNQRLAYKGIPFDSSQVRFVPDEILVKFKPSLSIQAIESTIKAYQSKNKGRIPRIHVYLLQIPEYSTVEEMVFVLSQNPDVEYVEPNYIFHISVTPNDFYFRYQYALSNTSQRVAPVDIPGAPTGKLEADIKATNAWDETLGTEEVIIAVIDTGVDLDHRDIKNKLVSSGKDYCNNDDEADDDQGHGTHVAGIAAAETNNDEGIAGVAWNCKILPIKVFDKTGDADTKDITEAIIWAADQGAGVISMSFGGKVGFGKNVSQTIEDSLKYAFNKNIILVSATGNTGEDIVYYPASSEYTLAVAATDSNDLRPSWSNYGPEVDVAAPGDWIVSLYPEDLSIPLGFAPYAWWSGTSMSVPHVSGLAALIKSIKPWLTSTEIMNIIRYSADDINSADNPGKDEFIGYGRINMKKALVPLLITPSQSTSR